MSVLNLPRLNFSGQTLWNPDTSNNSPGVYDENTLQLAAPGVAPADFVQWLTTYDENPPAGQQGLNGSWNVYGDAGCWFRDVRVGGVQFDYGTTTTDDPICTTPGVVLQMVGELFREVPPGGPPPPARMCDVAPYQSTTTQLFFKTIQLGDQNLGFIAGGASRMYLRWSILRNTDFPELPIAGPGGVIFQTSAHAKDIQWFGVENSPALQALQKAANAAPNQGITLQFAVYLTQYYKNATFNGQPITNAQQLAAAYAAGFTGPNPAQSSITGTIGVWGPDELATAPTQLVLNPVNAVTPPLPVLSTARAVQEGMVTAAPQAPTPFRLGPAVAAVDPKASNLALSFVETILETDLDSTKENLGPLTLNVVDGNGASLSTIATIPYSDPHNKGYDKASYLQSSGILDFALTPQQLGYVQNPANALQVTVQQSGKPVVALQQIPLVVETDQRGTYLDQGETATLTANVYLNGAPAPDNVKVVVAQYYEDPSQDNFPYILVTSANQPSACLDFGGGQFQITAQVSNGTISFPMTSVNAGTSMIGFFPYVEGTTPPAPVASGFPSGTNFYAVVRCLGFDNALLDLPDDQVNWTNTYNEVLQTYSLVYPQMSRIRNLSNENVVAGMAEQILAATKYPDNFLWTMFMPVSREMSAGKRNLLQRFCVKVINNEV